jgi:chromosomal replication initiation ATPase DnaA
LFEHGRKDEPRVVGDDAFTAAVTGRAAPVQSQVVLDDIIACVVRKQGVSLRSVLSRSRGQEHVLARALIAWKATQNGFATLAEVAARLGRDPSTLWTAMENRVTQIWRIALGPAAGDDFMRWRKKCVNTQL